MLSLDGLILLIESSSVSIQFHHRAQQWTAVGYKIIVFQWRKSLVTRRMGNFQNSREYILLILKIVTYDKSIKSLLVVRAKYN